MRYAVVVSVEAKIPVTSMINGLGLSVNTESSLYFTLQ